MIEELVEQIESRFAELSEQMSDPEVIGDQRRLAEVGRAYNSLRSAHALAQEWRTATSNAEGARELLDEDGDDPEMRDELERAEARLGELEEEIRLAMVESDPNDDKNVIIEVRGGAGGRRPGSSPATCTACSAATPSAAASSPRCCRPPTATTPSRSRVRAPTRCSSTRAAPTGCSGCPRPSPRAASTPPRRRWRSCPRPRRSRWRSTPATCRSTSTARRARAGSR